MSKTYRVSLPASREQLTEVLARLQDNQLNEHDRQLLMRLLHQLLGPFTAPPAAPSPSAPHSPPAPATPPAPCSEMNRKRRGHGRRAAADYSGAPRVFVSHPRLHAGDGCPDPLCRGHLFDTREPAQFVRFTGQPLVGATRYEQQVLRCSRCLQRFAAPLPADVPAEKWDATADVAIAMAKYAAGLPFFRLARLQQAYGIPLPESVQWERCEAVADALLPVYLYLRRLAAKAAVLVSDDTRVQILACCQQNQQRAQTGERCGLHTTGIVAHGSEQPPRSVVLYRSGRQHAGENVGDLLRLRPSELGPPLQVGDALAANWSHSFPVIAVKCLAHARRQFADIEEIFPDECRQVCEALATVYRYEAETKTMTPEQRLAHHQRHSAPVMEGLRRWIQEQFQQHRVEPNSVLGKAFAYLERHWEGLTQFLRQIRAPLDSNLVERALKRVVLHRKNALFFRTEHGAAVGDIVMSVIETCRANGMRAWDYLVHAVQNARAVRENPAGWLPWAVTADSP